MIDGQIIEKRFCRVSEPRWFSRALLSTCCGWGSSICMNKYGAGDGRRGSGGFVHRRMGDTIQSFKGSGDM
jgi:hypothetical protein